MFNYDKDYEPKNLIISTGPKHEDYGEPYGKTYLNQIAHNQW